MLAILVSPNPGIAKLVRHINKNTDKSPIQLKEMSHG
jgi:hypothetical protein